MHPLGGLDDADTEDQTEADNCTPQGANHDEAP